MQLSFSNKKAESRRLPEGVAIQPRKPVLNGFSNVKKYWLKDNPILSHINNAFSIAIPPGERFFIKSVKYYEDKIKDPELKELVRAFVQQEAQHFKAHDDLNEAIKQAGVDVDTLKEEFEKTFSRIERWVPKKLQLAMTVFAEHLTATGAEIHLTVPEFREAMSPEMEEFWAWHAVEELEHKAVAFDVFKDQGGSYVTRVLAVPALFLLVGRTNIKMVKKLLRDDNIPDDEYQKAVADMKAFHRNAAAAKIVKRNMKRYFARDFHPWEHDSMEAIRYWYERNPDMAA